MKTLSLDGHIKKTLVESNCAKNADKFFLSLVTPLFR